MEQAERADLHPRIIALANSNAGLNRTDTVKIFKKYLDDYQAMLISAIDTGYDGTLHDPDHEKYKWDTASAILFTASILTTIGYGHVAPSSEMGRLAMILYSLLAIPLMTMFLLNIGAAVADGVRYAYGRGCCYLCWRKRERTHGRWPPPNSKKAKKAKKDKVGVAEEGESTQAWDGKDPKDKKEEEEDENTEVPHSLTLFIVVMYIVLGTVVFSLWSGEDDWSIINSLYFCWVTLITIGFGDLVPGLQDIDTISGQLRMTFAAFYIILGLAILGAGVDLATDAIAKGAAKAAEKMKKKEEDDKRRAEEKKPLLEHHPMDAVSMSKAADDLTPPAPVLA